MRDDPSRTRTAHRAYGIRLEEHSDSQGRIFAEAIANSIRDGLLVLGSDLRVEAANAAFYETFRVAPDAVEGRSLFELGGGLRDIPELRELLERVLPRREAIERFEIEHDFEGLGRRALRLKARKLASLERIALLIEDVTEQRRADEALRQSEERYRQLSARLEALVAQRTEQLALANRELDAFNYSVSHDLRAPLRGVDGFAQALLEDYGERLDATGRGYLERVRAGAQRMGALIDDVLRLSRISRSDVRVRDVELAAIVREVVGGLRERDPERRVDVRCHGGLVARGDEGLLRIALENLLENAWKFTSAREEARIEVGTEERGGERTYFVRDDGDGFDPVYADKLFVPFQRLHSDDRFQGSGIGLPMVQRVVHLHGGRVWAEGAPGEGATFRFTLGTDAGPAGGGPRAAPSRCGSGPRGLVALPQGCGGRSRGVPCVAL